MTDIFNFRVYLSHGEAVIVRHTCKKLKPKDRKIKMERLTLKGKGKGRKEKCMNRIKFFVVLSVVI